MLILLGVAPQLLMPAVAANPTEPALTAPASDGDPPARLGHRKTPGAGDWLPA